MPVRHAKNQRRHSLHQVIMRMGVRKSTPISHHVHCSTSTSLSPLAVFYPSSADPAASALRMTTFCCSMCCRCLCHAAHHPTCTATAPAKIVTSRAASAMNYINHQVSKLSAEQRGIGGYPHVMIRPLTCQSKNKPPPPPPPAPPPKKQTNTRE